MAYSAALGSPALDYWRDRVARAAVTEVSLVPVRPFLDKDLMLKRGVERGGFSGSPGATDRGGSMEWPAKKVLDWG